MTHVSIKDAITMGLIPPEQTKKSKYHSKKVVIDGITFDSQKEARKYCELKLLKKAGEIVDFELQPEFILQEGYRDSAGKWIRPIKYKADFRIVHPNGREVIIDTKGYRTEVYRLKKKMLLKRYPDIEFREE